ncbi:MAG: bifunctional isocitrate dehydrogenase kinase/phosphatase [Granulosicoccus sp.]
MTEQTTIARVILDGFDKHYRLFREISAGACQRFEHNDWSAVDEANRARIKMYDSRVHESVERLRKDFPHVQHSGSEWPAIKLAYVALLHQHLQPECAETFFNSVACQVLHRRYYNNAHIFWRPSVATDYLEGQRPTLMSYYPRQTGLRRALLDMVTSFPQHLRWRSLRADIRHLETALHQAMGAVAEKPNHQLQILGSLFYRNKGAYIVGREINSIRKLPFVISLVQTSDGELFIDALITDAQDMALLFSFSRAYFMVDMDVPAAYVSFLHELMPNKPIHEIYSLLGLQKHGKTILYRELHHHLQFSRDTFRIADGIRGMVMLVFTLPSYPFVFKIIRDRFDPPKSASRAEVREKYRLVKNHDRVGRLADTLEFSNVALPLDRIDAELLSQLKSDASMNIEIERDRIIIKHVYIERRMTPLNTYLADVEGEERTRIIRDYGHAIRELAGADIFPGDMMLKNFGVTRHGRVVFYDYDEICYMHECNFRKIPPTPEWMDETTSEPWYSVRAEDVFPESFAAYFFSSAEDKETFRRQHGDLTTADFWKEQQQLIESDSRTDVFPYPDAARLEYREKRKHMR